MSITIVKSYSKKDVDEMSSLGILRAAVVLKEEFEQETDVMQRAFLFSFSMFEVSLLERDDVVSKDVLKVVTHLHDYCSTWRDLWGSSDMTADEIKGTSNLEIEKLKTSIANIDALLSRLTNF